jgi:hypothetical protein
MDERRLRVFENIVLRRIFELKDDDIVGGWKKLHNVDLHGLYFSPNVIEMINSRSMKWAGLATHIGEKQNAYRFLVGNPEGKRQQG